MQELIQQVYQSAFNNLTASGAEFPVGFAFPFLHKGRFIRMPHQTMFVCQFNTLFPAATAFILRSGLIKVRNSYGEFRLFNDPQSAGQFLVEL